MSGDLDNRRESGRDECRDDIVAQCRVGIAAGGAEERESLGAECLGIGQGASRLEEGREGFLRHVVQTEMPRRIPDGRPRRPRAKVDRLCSANAVVGVYGGEMEEGEARGVRGEGRGKPRHPYQ
jgi:hypothetical protein